METETFEKENSQKTAILEKSAKATTEVAVPPLPQGLRYLMLGLLILGISGAVIFAFVRLNPAKLVTSTVGTQENCADPVTENRLRDTLSKSPNDFATLVDWGDYNSRCRKPADYLSAISSYQGATRLADNPANNIQTETRLEVHLNLGLAYLYNGNFKAAQNEFHLILNEQPKNTFALLVLGGALVKEDPQQALIYLKQVVELASGTQLATNAQALVDGINKSLVPTNLGSPTPIP